MLLDTANAALPLSVKVTPPSAICCLFADTPSPSILKHLLKGERGVQQNDCLADGRSRCRRP